MTPYQNNRKNIKWLLALMALLGLAMLAIPFLLTAPAYLYLQLSDSQFTETNLTGLSVTVTNNETGISHTTPVYPFGSNYMVTVGKIVSGKNSWQVKVDHYHPTEFSVDILPLERKSVSLALKPAYGRLRIIPQNGLKAQEPISGQLKLSVGDKEISKNASEEIVISHLSPGNHLLYAEVQGYYPLKNQPAAITEGETQELQIDLIPQLKDNEAARIVLRWKENPRDLDSHLMLPDEKNVNKRHVFYVNKESKRENRFIAQLDVDDTDSFGPEITTIYPELNGTYKYAVYQYTDDGFLGTTSKAVIEVYTHQQNPVQKFTVPTGDAPRWWYVFDLDVNGTNVQIVPVNQLRTRMGWQTGKKDQD